MLHSEVHLQASWKWHFLLQTALGISPRFNWATSPGTGWFGAKPGEGKRKKMAEICLILWGTGVWHCAEYFTPRILEMWLQVPAYHHSLTSSSAKSYCKLDSATLKFSSRGDVWFFPYFLPFFFWDRILLLQHPGWRVMVWSQLTAASTFLAQAILSLQPPK